MSKQDRKIPSRQAAFNKINTYPKTVTVCYEVYRCCAFTS